jgi:hypothetical protein
VASYETVLHIPLAPDATFAFVSDFRNAARWDPRTYSVEKATEGEIGVGTRFILVGGMLPEATVRRLHLPGWLAGMALPYDIVEFDPPNEFVLKGETRALRYCDHLEFAPEGEGTRLRYYAELEMKGPFSAVDGLLQRMFSRIGDDATRDLPAAAVAAT